MIEPNSFVDTQKLFDYLEIPETSRPRAEDLLRVRMVDILTCLPRALNGWTPAPQVENDREAPPFYAAISDMSPDRRRFYLADKRRAKRMVMWIDSRDTALLTVNPRYPIDLCCVHFDREYPMYVYYSSQITTPAKIGSDGTEHHLGRLGHAAIVDRGVRLDESLLAQLPRSKLLREKKNYAWLRIALDGSPMLSADQYPNNGSAGLGAIKTIDWYLWFSILGCSVRSRVARFSVKTFDVTEHYFVYKNTYHTVIQKLRTDNSVLQSPV
jgi:hypothetical protein